MRLLIVDARVTGRDRAALARLIESAQADVACVHRAPHLLRWRSICAALGRRSGLVVVGGGRPAGTNLLMSTLGVDVLDVVDVPLAHPPGQHAGAALALLGHGGSGGARFVLGALRLGGDASRRVEQAQAAHRALTRFAPDAPPAVLAVDGLGAPADADADAAAEVLRSGRHEVSAGVFVDAGAWAGAPQALPYTVPAGVPAPTVVELTVAAKA